MLNDEDVLEVMDQLDRIQYAHNVAAGIDPDTPAVYTVADAYQLAVLNKIVDQLSEIDSSVIATNSSL